MSLGGKITEQIAEQIIDKILYICEFLDVINFWQYVYIYISLKKEACSSNDMKFSNFPILLVSIIKKFDTNTINFLFEEYFYIISKGRGEFDINKSLENQLLKQKACKRRINKRLIFLLALSLN